MDCTTCGHYQLKLMVTSGKPCSYSGDIPCLRCCRFSNVEDLHTHKTNGIAALNLSAQQHANPDKFILDSVKGI